MAFADGYDAELVLAAHAAAAEALALAEPVRLALSVQTSASLTFAAGVRRCCTRAIWHG